MGGAGEEGVGAGGGRDEVGESCAICVEEFSEGQELAEMPCGGRHTFHVECIRTWLVRLLYL